MVEDSGLQHLVLDEYNWIALPTIAQPVAVPSDLLQDRDLQDASARRQGTESGPR